MTATQKVYCTAPWTGLTVREDGHVRTCCAGKISLGNLNQISMDDVIKSDSLKQIQQRMLSGEPDLKNCQDCINNQSQSGLATLKQHYNLFYPEIIVDQFELKTLTVFWNNACNIGCVYCGPTFSSVWENRDGIKRSSVSKNYQDDLLNWILDRSHQLNEIMLVGGEPMLMKQNYKLLERLSPQCKITVITNLNYNLPKLPCISDLLKKSRESMSWNVSLENTGAKFNYVRNGADWNQIEENIRYINQHWNDSISVNFVYGMFSAFDIVDTIKTLHRLGIKKINIFPINDNQSMNVFNMPEIICQKAAEQLELAQQWHLENLHPEDRNFYPMQGVDSLLDQLKQSTKKTEITLDMFLAQVNAYDRYNHQKFRDLWPNVIDLVDKYL